MYRINRSSAWLLGLSCLLLIEFCAGRVLAQTDRNVGEMAVRVFHGHTSYVYGVAFFPDGKQTLSWSFDQTVRRWDVETGEELASYPMKMVNDVAIFPDGKKAIFARGQYGGTQRITIFDLEKSEEIATWQAHSMPVTKVQLHPNGKSAVTSSSDGTSIHWDIEAGKELRTFEVASQAMSPDGKLIAAGTMRSQVIAIYNLESGEQLASWRTAHGDLRSIDFSPDGKFLLTSTINHSNAGAQLWEVQTGVMVRNWIIGHQLSARFSPDGKRFLTADTESRVRLWDIDAQLPLKRFVGHNKWATSAVFSPDGKLGLSSAYDNTLRLWQLPTP